MAGTCFLEGYGLKDGDGILEHQGSHFHYKQQCLLYQLLLEGVQQNYGQMNDNYENLNCNG